MIPPVQENYLEGPEVGQRRPEAGERGRPALAENTAAHEGRANSAVLRRRTARRGKVREASERGRSRGERKQGRRGERVRGRLKPGAEIVPEEKRGSAAPGGRFLPGSGERHARDEKADARGRHLERWQRTDLRRLRAVSDEWNASVINAYRARAAEQRRLAGG